MLSAEDGRSFGRHLGDDLARRLAAEIRGIEGVSVPVGTLDITFYRDDIERAKRLTGRGLHYVDCVMSGALSAPASRHISSKSPVESFVGMITLNFGMA